MVGGRRWVGMPQRVAWRVQVMVAVVGSSRWVGVPAVSVRTARVRLRPEPRSVVVWVMGVGVPGR